MFKKPATLKPASPLRSSARRAFIAHLQLLYPILNHIPAEKVTEIVPNGLKQCGAMTSGGHKAIIYTDEQGKPLWFEVGHDAGLALQQSQQQHKKQAHTNSQNKSSIGKANNLAEVIPTIYTLWLMPNLLPRLPTWPQIIDPTLLNGSALMIPGLISSPHTFPDSLQWCPPSSTDEQAVQHVLPSKSSLISIIGYPSSVPLVIGRLDMDIQEIINKRKSGEKGKAASTIHAFGDQLWELGGKGLAPDEEEMEKRTKLIDLACQVSANGQVEELDKAMDTITLEVADLTPKSGSDEPLATRENAAGEGSGVYSPNGSTFSIEEVDEILHLALLTSLKNISKQTPSALPMPTSALYSTHVLPNRPSNWPPFDPKGRKRARLPPSLISSAANVDIEEAKVVENDSTDIRQSSAKKLAKWIKQEEKNGLFKSKDVKGKDTVIVSINSSHPGLKGLESYQTISQLQQQKQAVSENNADQAAVSNGNGNETLSNSSNSKLTIVIERFWRPNSSSVKLFQEMGCDTSTPMSKPVIRKHLLDFINAKELIDPRNQALVRIQDPHLTHALYPKVALNEIPAALRREELLDRLLATSCNEFHRTNRLTADHAVKVIQMNTKEQDSNSSSIEELQLNTTLGESIGPMNKGAAQSVKVEIRTRQGRKVVSLITNVEIYSIDPEQFAADLMRIVGASASCTPLPGSTAKHPKQEIFVQGDQRKAIFDLLESQHGLDRKHVQIHDMTKK